MPDHRAGSRTEGAIAFAALQLAVDGEVGLWQPGALRWLCSAALGVASISGGIESLGEPGWPACDEAGVIGTAGAAAASPSHSPCCSSFPISGACCSEMPPRVGGVLLRDTVERPRHAAAHRYSALARRQA